MEISRVALNALYFPLVVLVGVALWEFGSSLYRVVRAGDFKPSQHGLWLALVLAMAADFIENIFYGVARVIPGLYLSLGYSVPAVAPMKLLILLAAVVAVDSYSRLLHRKPVLVYASAWAVLLWLVAFVLMVEFG